MQGKYTSCRLLQCSFIPWFWVRLYCIWYIWQIKQQKLHTLRTHVLLLQSASSQVLCRYAIELGGSVRPTITVYNSLEFSVEGKKKLLNFPTDKVKANDILTRKATLHTTTIYTYAYKNMYVYAYFDEIWVTICIAVCIIYVCKYIWVYPCVYGCKLIVIACNSIFLNLF